MLRFCLGVVITNLYGFKTTVCTATFASYYLNIDQTK